MPAANVQLERAASKRCRIREASERKPSPAAMPYSEEEIELFALRLGWALSRPGAIERISDRIDELLQKARKGR
jgi:hypothetical protein